MESGRFLIIQGSEDLTQIIRFYSANILLSESHLAGPKMATLKTVTKRQEKRGGDQDRIKSESLFQGEKREREKK